MLKIIRLSFVLISISIISAGYAFAQTGNATWTVEVIGASGLKNTDWGPNKLSDPFADIYIYSSKGSQFRKNTPVLSDTLNPQWKYKVTQNYPSDETIFRIVCVLWDQDKISNRFLGVAEVLNPVPGREYSLNLHGRGPAGYVTVPGKRLRPGKLKIRVDVKYPPVNVPNIKGKTVAEAKNLLESAGLVPASPKLMIVQDKASVGKVLEQAPNSGASVPRDSHVFFIIGKLRTYTMPRVINSTLDDAKKRLKQFSNIHLTYVSPPVSLKREKWLTVKQQSPLGGQRNLSIDAPINLIVWRPSEDYKLVVPDVTGETPQEAAKALDNANFPLYTFKKQKISDSESDNKVLSQEPKGDEEIAWDENKPVSLTVGWYADGKSLYAAKLTNLDEPFEETFDTPGSAVYRSVKITQPGYLILKNIQGPDNINPLAVYYNYDQKQGWQEQSERAFYLPSAYRVTPGECVVRIKPEMRESVNDKPCQFELSFIPEFDPAEPNNSIEQAVEIAPDAEMTIGFMGSYDDDVYSFQVEKPGYLEVLSEKLPSESVDAHDLDIGYTLYNDQKEKVGSYYMPSASYLPVGRYYIDFDAAEDSWSLMRYKLTMRFHPAEDVGEPNDTKETAYTVEAGTSIPVAYSVNDEDYYRIKTDEPGYAVLSHDSDIPFDVDFYRYDANGEKTGAVEHLPTAVRVDGERLVSLKAVSESHGYVVDPPVNLQIGFISGKEDTYEPNDTPEQAASVELNQEIDGLLMPRRELDNYAFNVASPGKIYFDMVKPEGEDISVKGRLISSDGKTVVANDLYLPAEATIKEPGRYILQFGQEPGLQKFCPKQYKLTIRDGKAESASDNKVPSERYGETDQDGCIKKAEQAYQLLSDEKYQEARDLYQQALQCRPENAVIWNDYAVSCYHLKETAEAEKALNKAVELNKDYALAYRNLALIQWEKGDNGKGVNFALKAVELDASDENLRYAAHAYILLADGQDMPEKRQSLENAAKYYRKMKKIPDASKENLEKIEQLLKQENGN